MSNQVKPGDEVVLDYDYDIGFGEMDTGQAVVMCKLGDRIYAMTSEQARTIAQAIIDGASIIDGTAKKMAN